MADMFGEDGAAGAVAVKAIEDDVSFQDNYEVGRRPLKLKLTVVSNVSCTGINHWHK
jgi:hypothetical protein